MKTLHPSSQYKRDLKRIRNNKKKTEALREILSILENELPIPMIYKPHMLTGDYIGCMEVLYTGRFPFNLD